MSSGRELDEGIKSIKSAWRREHTARANLEKMLEQAEAENDRLREFAGHVLYCTTMTDGCGDNCPYSSSDCGHECHLREQGRKLGVEV